MRLILMLAAAVGALAQDAPRPEIHGTVTEFGTRLGIAGAQVTLLPEGQTQAVLSGTTDSQGMFDLHPDQPGHYSVRVQAEGYKPVQDSNIAGLAPIIAVTFARVGQAGEQRVVITNGNPKEEIHFTLVRPGELRGSVIDDETGQPLAKVPVTWVMPNGQRGFVPGPQTLTDDQGEFVFPSVLPGSYAVETHPRVAGQAQIVTAFTEDDSKRIDEDLEQVFWPGGREFNNGALLAVGAGQTVSVGAIKVRRAIYYRALVELGSANCAAGEMAQAELRAASGVMNQVMGRAPCGAPFLIRGIQPGWYVLRVYAGATPETRAQTSVPIEIRDANVQVAALLDRGIDIDGQVVVAEGASAPALNEISLRVLTISGVAFASQPVGADAEGRFRVANLPRGTAELTVFRLPAGFYLRELRYNGHAQNQSAFTIDAGGSSQRLEVVIDNNPSAITGAVEDSDRPVNKPAVLAAKWPLAADSPEMQRLGVHRVSGSADGKFQMGGLPPGEYRVIAVADADKDKLNQPGVLDRLFASAEKVTLERGAAADVHLKLSDPAR